MKPKAAFAALLETYHRTGDHSSSCTGMYHPLPDEVIHFLDQEFEKDSTRFWCFPKSLDPFLRDHFLSDGNFDAEGMFHFMGWLYNDAYRKDRYF